MRTESRRTRLVGVVTLVAAALLLVTSFRLETLSGILAGGGVRYSAEFTDVAGIDPGDPVRIAGITVGTVDGVHVDGDRAIVDLTVRDAPPLGDRTTAALSLDTLLGQSSLVLNPAGSGRLPANARIPLSRTSTPFGVTDALLGSAEAIEPIHTKRLTQALTTVAGALDPAAPEVRTAATGLSALARAVGERDRQVRALFSETAKISSTLAGRSRTITALIRDSGSILVALQNRQQVIRDLLRDTGRLTATVSAVIEENRGQVGPALRSLHTVLTVLRDNQDDLDESLRLMAPYLRYFTNVIGNGRWFDGTFAGLVPFDTRGDMGLPDPSTLGLPSTSPGNTGSTP